MIRKSIEPQRHKGYREEKRGEKKSFGFPIFSLRVSSVPSVPLWFNWLDSER